MLWNVQSFMPTAPELSKNTFNLAPTMSLTNTVLAFWPSDYSDKYQSVNEDT